MKIFASHNQNNTIRLESSAGGIFSLIAENILNQKGIVYGAAFDDNWNVYHRRIDSYDDLQYLRRSKYVFSDYKNSLNSAINDLKLGHKVLYVGVPCQIAALRKLVGDNPDLLCIEVVCHGAPKAEYWQKYLEELCSKLKREKSEITEINFRDKRSGWKNYSFSIRFNDNTEFSQLHHDNLYMRAFLADYTLRHPCFKCKFKYPLGSCADITLGDFWGISQLAPEIDNDSGTTLIIARTPLGDEATRDIPILKTVRFEDAVKYNPAISYSPQMPDQYEAFQSYAKASPSVLRVFKKYTKLPLILRLKIKIHRILHRS